MARPVDVLLDVDRVVAERVLRLALRRGERARAPPGSRTTRMPFPPPPAAALSSTGKPNCSATCARLVDVAQRLGRSGHHGRAGGDRQLPRRRLAPHRRDRLGGWPDEDEPGVAHRAREPLALGEEAVAGMDRLGADARRRRDDRIAPE